MSKERLKQMHKEMGLTTNEKIAVWLTRNVGTMGMFYILAAWYVGWMVLNTLLGKNAFDPYPFPLLLFFSNAIQLLWLPILSVGQNVIDRERSIQANEDLEMGEEQGEKLEELQGEVGEIQVDFDQMHKDIQDLKAMMQQLTTNK